MNVAADREHPCDASPEQCDDVLFIDRPADDDGYIVTVQRETFSDDLIAERQVRAGQDRQTNDVGALITSGAHNLEGTATKPEIDDLGPRIS